MPEANLAQVKKFFGPRADGANSAKAFSEEWKNLSNEEQNEIKALVADVLN